MNEVFTIVTAAYAYVQEHWSSILVLIGGAGGLSVMLEYVLNKLHVDSKKVAFSLLQLFSGLTALVAVVPTSLPTKDVAPVYATLLILAQTWHRFVISPVYNNKVVPFLEDLAQVRANRVPATTVSSTPEIQPDQFV